MLKDEHWPVARLIPITGASGVEAQERRAASALLAVIGAVEEFGRALLRPLGAPAGKIATYIEVPFKFNGRSVRPDGMIAVARGNKQWLALVEMKVGSSQLEPEQIDLYLDLAKDQGFDAVLSISNQYVTSSSSYPLEIDRRKTRKVDLHHWSWVDVLTEAVVQERHRGVKDPDQAYILQELIRYLEDTRSGVVKFENMGPSWTAVKDGAREQTLRKGDPAVADVSVRWDELIRYLALRLTRHLGQDVKQLLSKEEKSPAARQQALRDALVGRGQLHAELAVPNAAGSIEVLADLRSRQVTASTTLGAPLEGRTKGRVSWLLRQLQSAPDTVKVEVKAARSQTTYAASLAKAREAPDVLYPEANKEVRQFIVSLTRNLGMKKGSGPGSFIDSVLDTSEDFYGEVLQNLRAWKAAPPKLPKKVGPVEEAEEVIEDLPENIQKAVQVAEDEAATSNNP